MTIFKTYIDNREMATETVVDYASVPEETVLSADQPDAQIGQNEQFSAIGKMTASIVHDFKGSLTVIRGCAELLANPEINAEKREIYSKMILEDVNRFLTMSQDLLEYSRGSAHLDYHSVKVGIWLENLTDYIWQTKCAANVTLETRFDFAGEVELDEDRVRRVVMNIVTNALDAMPDGGHLIISSEMTGAKWRIMVCDTGSGIPVDIRSNVFEPFVTKGKQSGTGLGLATAWEIVEGHGGKLNFETLTLDEANGSGSGTTFVIELPVERPLAKY